MNYLDNWHQFFHLLKWKLVQQENNYFKNLDGVYGEIKSFFPEKDFLKETQSTENWLIHLLSNKKLFSIQILTEIAELLRYYNMVPEKESYNLKLRNGLINYREFNEKLFELYINYILKNTGLNPIVDHFYFSKEKNRKPMDLYVRLDGIDYNIEITKYYDSFADKMYDLSLTIKRLVEHKSVKTKIRLDELFVGYIGFKKKDIQIVSKVKELVRSKMNEHFHLFRNGENKISYSPKITTDDYEFVMQPSYLTEEKDLFKADLQSFSYFIQFTLKPIDFQRQLSHFSVRGELSGNLVRQNEDLLEKIQKKLNQHRDYSNPMLIVIGIDNILSTFNKGVIPAIRYENVDRENIFNHLPKNVILLLIFREAINDYMTMKSLIIGDLTYHSKIFSFLKNINYDIRYTGRNTMLFQ